MSVTVGELINQKQVDDNFVQPTQAIKRRAVQRPENEVHLKSLLEDKMERVESQQGPTKELIWLPRCATQEEVEYIIHNAAIDFNHVVYYVYAINTEESWVCPTKRCLDQNFIYRNDLIVKECKSLSVLCSTYLSCTRSLKPNVVTRKKCYILDNPANETYEVYYDTDYVVKNYGKSTPRGMYIHAYADRFLRDMAILQLDNTYTNSSVKKAGELIARNYAPDEAIIISDGAFIREAVTCTYIYLDDKSVIRMSEGTVATNEKLGVTIAELSGAYNALMMCKQRSKKRITYYYDNVAIVDVFRRKRLDDVTEVKRYKELCEELYNAGCTINFVEIHPKTGENRDVDNRALIYFHNSCDSACTEIADVFKKDYKTIATSGRTNGRTYSHVRNNVNQKYKFKNNYQQREQKLEVTKYEV